MFISPPSLPKSYAFQLLSKEQLPRFMSLAAPSPQPQSPPLTYATSAHLCFVTAAAVVRLPSAEQGAQAAGQLHTHCCCHTHPLAHPCFISPPSLPQSYAFRLLSKEPKLQANFTRVAAAINPAKNDGITRCVWLCVYVGFSSSSGPA